MKYFLQLFILLFSFSPLIAQRNNLTLAYHFKIGQEFRLLQETKQNIVQEISGEKQYINTTLGGSFHFKILALLENGAKIQTMYENITMLSESAMGKIEMDSDAPDSSQNIFSKLIKSICKLPFYIEMNRQGEIIKVEGIELLIDSMMSRVDTLPEFKKSILREQLTKQLGPESFKGSLEMALVQYSSKPLKKNDTWQSIVKIRNGFKSNIYHNWQLVDIQGNIANLTSNAEMKSIDPNEVSQVNGYDIKANLNGKQTTQSEIDLTTGWPVKTNIVSEMKGVVRMLQFEMDIPSDFKTTSTFKLVKIK
jgi:hypothetical protein